MGLKSLYDAHAMPRLVTLACGQRAIFRRRREIVPLASGHVFELGCGGGLNLALYDRARVESLAGIDPHARLISAARNKAQAGGWPADFRAGTGEAIPFPDRSFDTAVCTFTLCSVSDPSQVLRELRRVLRPDGRLLFLEHGRAPDPQVAKWQHRIEPLWKPIAGGCHLTRLVGTNLRASGFEVEPLGQGYLDRAPRMLGWMEWGTARPRGA